jgi:hypothetical protein
MYCKKQISSTLQKNENWANFLAKKDRVQTYGSGKNATIVMITETK